MEKLKNMKIGKKMLVSFAIVLLLFLVNVIVSIVSINQVSKQFTNFYSDQYIVMNGSEKFIANLEGFGKSISRMALSSEGNNSDTIVAISAQQQNADDYYQGMQDNLAILKTCESVSNDELSNIETKLTNLNDSYEKMKQLFLNGDTAQGVSVFENEYYQQGQDLLSLGNEMIDEADSAANDAHAQSQKLVLNLFIFSVGFSLCLVAVAIYISVRMTKSIVNPLEELRNAAKEMADGNLHFDIEYESKNELGDLASDFRKTRESIEMYIGEISKEMKAIGKGELTFNQEIEFVGDFCEIQTTMEQIRNALTQIMSQINSSADQVMQGAKDIAESGQDLSQATLEQASSVEELAATINEVSLRVQDNAENAIESSKMAEIASNEVMEAGKKVKQLSISMTEMKAMSREITKIMKDIEDIAFQTNILSLNAAVEAARAGEAGKGFSVVANEIRSLSSKTSEASKSTSDLIGKTVSMMEDGNELAINTSNEFSEMAKVVKDSAMIVDKIAKASNEQANAIVQIRQSIEMINEIVQQNSATAEESAASSEELTGQMKMLKELVEIFKF